MVRFLNDLTGVMHNVQIIVLEKVLVIAENV